MKDDPVTVYGLIAVGLLVVVLLWNGRPSRQRRRDARIDALFEQAAREKRQRDEGTG